MPVTGSFRHNRHLWSRHPWNLCPVPHRENPEIFIPVNNHIRTTVRKKISFQILTITILTSGRTGRNHTDIKRITRAYMQSIISPEVMCMQRSYPIIGRSLSLQTFHNSPIFIGMLRSQYNHSFGKQRHSAFIGNTGTAHSTSQYIKQHILTTNGLIISLPHELIQNSHFLRRQSVLSTLCIHCHLRHSF